MTAKYIDVEILKVTALLQHRFGEEAEAPGETRRVKLQDRTPREQAEAAAYRKPDGTLYHPGAAISKLTCEAGSKHKQKGSRKSLKYLVSAAMIVMDDAIILRHPDTGEPLEDFEVDSRPVVIPATKGRIMRHRPRHDEWMARFRIRVNENVLGVDTIHQLITEGGEQIGIGDYRPEKFGPFGTFRVTRFEEVRDFAEAAE